MFALFKRGSRDLTESISAKRRVRPMSSPQCTALLPELLAAYESPVESRRRHSVMRPATDPEYPVRESDSFHLATRNRSTFATGRRASDEACKARCCTARTSRPDPNDRGHRSRDVAVPHAQGVSPCPRLRRHSATARVALVGPTGCVRSNVSCSASAMLRVGLSTVGCALPRSGAAMSSRRCVCLTSSRLGHAKR